MTQNSLKKQTIFKLGKGEVSFLESAIQLCYIAKQLMN